MIPLIISRWLVLILPIILASYRTIHCGPADSTNAPLYVYRSLNQIPDYDVEDETPENFNIENKIPKIGNHEISSTGRETQTNVTKCGDRKANRAKQDESCYYPHRFNQPLYCFYSLIWGSRTDNDKQAFKKTYRTKSTTKALKIKFQDPDDRSINFIMVEDPKNNKSKRIFEDYVRIREGGMNCSNVTMTIESDDDSVRHYKVIIFVEE